MYLYNISTQYIKIYLHRTSSFTTPFRRHPGNLNTGTPSPLAAIATGS